MVYQVWSFKGMQTAVAGWRWMLAMDAGWVLAGWKLGGWKLGGCRLLAMDAGDGCWVDGSWVDAGCWRWMLAVWKLGGCWLLAMDAGCMEAGWMLAAGDGCWLDGSWVDAGWTEVGWMLLDGSWMLAGWKLDGCWGWMLDECGWMDKEGIEPPVTLSIGTYIKGTKPSRASQKTSKSSS
jgi:hypothetical protein